MSNQLTYCMSAGIEDILLLAIALTLVVHAIGSAIASHETNARLARIERSIRELNQAG